MAYGTVNADVIGTSVAGSNIGAGNASIMKNRLINSAMVIDQRNAGAAVTVNLDADFYPVDRWVARGQGSDGVFTAQQSSVAPAGFVNSVKYTVTTADSSIGALQYYFISQRIEGYNVADLNWGGSNAKTVTLSFWVQSSVTGTYGGCLSNSGNSRSYPFTYTISTANTWTQISVTIAGDTTGTWLTTNGVGLFIYLGLGVGSTLNGTANSWAGATYLSATGSTNWISTNGATFYITGVQLEVGSSATGYEYRQYGQELALCQRYFQKSYNQGVVAGTVTAYGAPTLRCTNNSSLVGYFQWTTALKVTMRTSPSNTFYSPATGASGKCRYVTTAVDVAMQDGGELGDGYISPYTNGTAATNEGIQFQFTASAEL
jgi:hypothetical protein